MKFKKLIISKLRSIVVTESELRLRGIYSGEIHSSIPVNEISFPIKLSELISKFDQSKIRSDASTQFIDYVITGVTEDDYIVTDTYMYPCYLMTSQKFYEIIEFREVNGVTESRNHMIPGSKFSHVTEFKEIPKKCIFAFPEDLNSWAKDYRVHKDIHDDLYEHPELIYDYLEGGTLKDWENYFKKNNKL